MRIRRTPLEILFDTCNYAFLALWGFIALYPMLFVLFGSLSNPTALARFRGLLIAPQGFSLISYKAVLMNPNILSGYRNTFIIVVFGTLINLTMTSLAAYFFSRRDVMLKGAFMIMIVITMYFGGGLIPNYIVVNSLGMNKTLWALMIPGAVSAFNMIVMRTSIQSSVPYELEEAAFIDGAGHFRILWQVVLPLSKAVMAVMALWYGVGHWNSWFSAAIYLVGRKDLWPLQLFIREIIAASQSGGDNVVNAMTQGTISEQSHMATTIRYSTIIVATVPVLLIYPFLQKHFVKGVMIGSLKG